MDLKSERELANTRKKLSLLEQDYEEVRRDEAEDEYLREVTMTSLKRLINQLKEEIARYEAHHLARR